MQSSQMSTENSKLSTVFPHRNFRLFAVSRASQENKKGVFPNWESPYFIFTGIRKVPAQRTWGYLKIALIFSSSWFALNGLTMYWLTPD